ncbi:MAG: LacI family transcriptional regulator [Armatimonadetes bacterium]|nr:LacI family transcriptional regulator [Armatimonadota bacterium]
MATTVYDIARAAGVGRTTVLRALWDKDDISPETKARIKKLAAEMKYRPNHIARSLVMGHSNFVGVMATPSVFPSSYGTIELIESALRDADYSMLLSSSGGHPGGERRVLEQLVANRVAGIIAIPASNSADPEVYQELIDSGVKMVTLDRCVEGLKAPQVIGDDYRAARLATEHLISLGHKSIVYLAIPLTSYAGRERARGFQDAMSEAGIRITSSSMVETQFGEEFGFAAVRELLKRKTPPTAIVARHDIVAAGVIRAIYAAGLSIPDDISLVGNGDIWCSDILRVPLTTVRHPIQDMARKAISKLLSMLSGESVDSAIEVLGVEFVTRMSTAPPRSR